MLCAALNRRQWLRVGVVCEPVRDASIGSIRVWIDDADCWRGGRLDAAHRRRPVHVRADPQLSQLLPHATYAVDQCTRFSYYLVSNRTIKLPICTFAYLVGVGSFYLCTLYSYNVLSTSEY